MPQSTGKTGLGGVQAIPIPPRSQWIEYVMDVLEIV
jgi:hypothetical protein